MNCPFKVVLKGAVIWPAEDSHLFIPHTFCLLTYSSARLSNEKQTSVIEQAR